MVAHGPAAFPAGTGHTAIRLVDGRVLVAGGGDRCGSAFNTAALFDPLTNTWSATGSMTATRQFHSAAPLQDGRVLVAGGVRGSPLRLNQRRDLRPSLGTWTAAGTWEQRDGRRATAMCSSGTSRWIGPCGRRFLRRELYGGHTQPNHHRHHRQPELGNLNALGRTQALTVTSQLSDGSSQRFTGPLQFAWPRGRRIGRRRRCDCRQGRRQDDDHSNAIGVRSDRGGNDRRRGQPDVDRGQPACHHLHRSGTRTVACGQRPVVRRFATVDPTGLTFSSSVPQWWRSIRRAS